jgi:hypothetical protein
VGGLGEGENGFLKAGTAVKPQIVFHTLSLGHVYFTLTKMFAVRDSNLTAMMLMMQVFLSVTQCHLAYGFRSFERTQYPHLQMSSNRRRTDVMFLCNI